MPSVCETFAAYQIENPWAQNPRKPLLSNAFAHCSPFPACCKPLTIAQRLSSAESRRPCRLTSCHLATSRRGDYSLSRSIAWVGCFVVRRLLYAVPCMYEQTPVYSCAAGIEPAHPTGRLIYVLAYPWGAPRTLQMSAPARLLPFRRASSLSPSVALVRVTAATLPVAALRARLARARTHCGAPLRFPALRGSCSSAVTLAPPRINPARRVDELPTAERRGHPQGCNIRALEKRILKTNK